MFNLNGIKIGTKLVNREGTVCVYVGRDIEQKTTITYPHAVSDREGTFCYTDDGRFMSTDHKHRWDIVGFAAKPKRVRIRKAKPVNKLLGVLEWVSRRESSSITRSGIYFYGTFKRQGEQFEYGYTSKQPYEATVGLETGKPVTVHTLNTFKGAVTKLLKG